MQYIHLTRNDHATVFRFDEGDLCYKLVGTMYGGLVGERLSSGVCAQLNEGLRREAMRDNWLVGMSNV